MKYEKSLTEIFQWKEESSNELYNLTIRERLEILTKSEKSRKYVPNHKETASPVQQTRYAHG